MGYDDILSLLGDFGPYQRRVYFLLCLPAIICAFHKLGNVFLLAEPDYRCKMPDELLNANYHLNISELQKWYPYDSVHKKYSSCNIFDKNVTKYDMNETKYDENVTKYDNDETRYDKNVTKYENNETKYCDGYIFNTNQYGHTAVIEWELTCKDAHYIAASNSIFMVGVMLGSIIFGDTSDRFGRKITFIISLALQVGAGTVAAFAPEFWTFTIARCLVGASSSGVFLVAYVMGMEMVGPSKRQLAGVIVFLFFSAGYLLIAAFALLSTNWQHLQLLLTLPGLAFLSYWWFIPESIRWLISKNRMTEAKELIQKVATANNVILSEETVNSLLLSEEEAHEKNKYSAEKKPSVLDLFKHSNLRKISLIVFFDWFANNITYYGLSWNTNNLGGNPYLNFVISGALEAPANIFLLLTLNKWGRKRLLCGSMLLAGTALLATMVVPKDMQWLTITLAMVGKISITASYGTIYVFSAELFPTVVRNAGLGASSTFARIGSIVAPYINITTHISPLLPLLIFGKLAFIGGLLSLYLPETLNKKLPETIEEGEAFGKTIQTLENGMKFSINDQRTPNEKDTAGAESTLLENKMNTDSSQQI